MTADFMSELECRRLFLGHRAAMPAKALARYAGRWIAWSPDGARIVAEAEAPEDLDDRVRAAGEDPQRCVIEGIPAADAMLGGDGLGPARGLIRCSRGWPLTFKSSIRRLPSIGDRDRNLGR